MGKNNLQVKYTTAAQQNDNTYFDYYKRLRLLALSIFKWNGLPESVSERYLEQTLFEMGQALFFKDPGLGFLATKCTISGKLNIYGDAVRYNAYGYTYSQMYDADKSVLVRNNYDREPTCLSIELFARRLSEVERTLDVNIQNQKTPYIIVCDDKQRLTFLNLYKQIRANEPVIYGNKSLNPNDIQMIPTLTPFLADKLLHYKHDIWNEAMSYLGLDNANTDKKERMITDEVSSNNELIRMSAQTMLLTRQKACEQINEMYPGLNVSVELRSDIIKKELLEMETMATQPDIEEPDGGETDE